MHSKSFALLALSATAVVASPFHKSNDFHRHRLHGTGRFSLRPTGTGKPFPGGNDTNGFVGTGTAGTVSVVPLTKYMTAPEVPTGANQVAAETEAEESCTQTETSTNYVTVTATASATATATATASASASASAADSAETKVVDLGEVSEVTAGAFYGDRTRTGGGNNGQTTAPAVSASAPVTSANNPSTTFASAPSAAKSSAGTESSAPASAPPSGSSGGKRGISFNDAGLVAAFGDSVSWSYNWAPTESGDLGGVEFVPMMWGRNDVSNFASKVGSATHVLGFNEPDLGEQANIDPGTAAQLHREGMKDLVGKVQIGSPSVTNGATTSPPLGVNWLDQFFKACGNDCPVDFVTFHWYATADSFEYFKQHVEDVIKLANNYGIDKVWLTEFKPEGAADAQAAFMEKAVAYLDSNPAVERYAAFMASEGTLLSSGSLNPIGSAYAGAS